MTNNLPAKVLRASGNMLAPAFDFSVPGANLEGYIAATHRIPMLTLEQEQLLADHWYHHQDIEAARQLIIAHLRFVVKIARGYLGYGLMLADLIQEGNIGLMKAVKKFDPAQGVRLVTFAIHWIKAEIHEFILRNWRIVKIATTKAQRKLFFKLRSAKQRLGENIAAIAKDLNIAPRTVADMNNRLSQPDGTIEEAYDIADYGADPARQCEIYSQAHDERESLTAALAALDPRSRDILAKRWLNEQKATLQDLADHYAVSPERIRQLEKNAMQKLKRALQDA